MSVCLYTHTSVRGEPGPRVWNCSKGLAAECYHSTLAKEEWALHRNSLSAEGLWTGRAASTACCWPTAGNCPDPCWQFSCQENLHVGAERDQHLCHTLQGKVSNNCRNQTQRRTIERSTREQFEALSEEFTHHRAGQNSCCG